MIERKDELADPGATSIAWPSRIEHLVTAQRQLLADVSHALRSPLARLTVALGLARRRNRQATPEHLDRIETEAERLNKLIGQLLTMARVDSGVDLERPTRFDLGSVVEEVSTDAEYEARHRQCAVAFDQRGACVVEGAREMLRGAVENVVRNAVRHTAERTRVEVSLDRRQAPGGSRAVIRVRDHGPGVPQTAVDGLFVPFNQVLTDGISNPERSGLGLAITRRTFEVHGGTATAANAPDGGFVVTLELPCRPRAPPDGNQIVALAPAHPAGSLSDWNILSTLTTRSVPSTRTARRSMLRVARPFMNVPFGWYFDSCLGH